MKISTPPRLRAANPTSILWFACCRHSKRRGTHAPPSTPLRPPTRQRARQKSPHTKDGDLFCIIRTGASASEWCMMLNHWRTRASRLNGGTAGRAQRRCHVHADRTSRCNTPPPSRHSPPAEAFAHQSRARWGRKQGGYLRVASGRGEMMHTREIRVVGGGRRMQVRRAIRQRAPPDKKAQTN